MAQRRVDVLILGAGIAGLLLARELRARGRSVAVGHDPARAGASEAAVGLLNPVRGRRCTLAWRAAETFAAARETYGAIAAATGEPVLRAMPVVRAFASPEERAFLERRTAAIAAAGFNVRELASAPAGFRDAGFGVVAVDGGGALDAQALTQRLRAELRTAGALIERRCGAGELELGSTLITWSTAELAAERLILAGGDADLEPAVGASLPMRPVRGESLLVRAPALAPDVAFVCGHHLAPVAPGLWSCGGTKVPGDRSWAPTSEGRAELERFLEKHLSVPWEIAGHACGVRAATLDTKPLVGPFGPDSRILAFNGLGSQGFSAGPWLARLLADHLVRDVALPPEVVPTRRMPGAARG